MSQTFSLSQTYYKGANAISPASVILTPPSPLSSNSLCTTGMRSRYTRSSSSYEIKISQCPVLQEAQTSEREEENPTDTFLPPPHAISACCCSLCSCGGNGILSSPESFLYSPNARNPHRVVVLDFETTGLSKKAQIIQIGAVEVVGSLPTGNTFYTNVLPCTEIERGATRVHGFRNADLEGVNSFSRSPSFDIVFLFLMNFIAGSPIVGHNIQYNIGILRKEAKRIGSNLPMCEIICTMKTFRRYYPGRKLARLEAVANFFTLNTNNKKPV